MSICFPLRCASLITASVFSGLVAAVLLLVPPVLWAQELPHIVLQGAVTPGMVRGGALGNLSDQEVMTNPEPGDRKLPLESIAPYSSWKHHVAEKPEQAVVQVRFAETANAPGGTATGLVVRCDGFVLVPRAVRDVARNGGRVEVVFPEVDGAGGGESAAGQMGKHPPVTALARYHLGTNASVPYALIKTNGEHVRSLPLLESDNVAPGQPVRLLWCAAGAGAASEVISQRGFIGPAAGTKEAFSISAVDGSANAAPVGAFVVDEASGAAVGMVTQGGASPVFTTFARFRVIAGEIGVAPDRAAVRLGDRPGALPKGAAEMVFVPGGPVALDGAAAKESSLAYGTTVACTPGFWMAVQPVTNGEYRTWLKGRGLPLPYGWSDNDLFTQVRRADRPVCGMLLEEAVSYASSHQSRLPTEVEWRRASYTRDVAWVEEMNANWNFASKEVYALLAEVSRQFQAAQRSAQAAAEQRAGILQNSRRPNIGGTGDGGNTHVNVLVPSTPEIDAASAELKSYVNDFLEKQELWGQVHLIDGFRQDLSVFGVRNVLINAPELVLSRLHYVTYAPKRYPARVDPDLVLFNASVGGLGAEPGAVSEAELRRLLWNSLIIISWRGGEATIEWRGSGGASSGGGNSSTPYTLGALASIRHQVFAGFRCAR